MCGRVYSRAKRSTFLNFFGLTFSIRTSFSLDVYLAQLFESHTVLVQFPLLFLVPHSLVSRFAHMQFGPTFSGLRFLFQHFSVAFVSHILLPFLCR